MCCIVSFSRDWPLTLVPRSFLFSFLVFASYHTIRSYFTAFTLVMGRPRTCYATDSTKKGNTMETTTNVAPDGLFKKPKQHGLMERRRKASPCGWANLVLECEQILRRPCVRRTSSEQVITLSALFKLVIIGHAYLYLVWCYAWNNSKPNNVNAL